jgi:hypothetical protein
MTEEVPIDEIQVRALAVADVSPSASYAPSLSAQILPFTLRSRATAAPAGEGSFQTLPSQPFAFDHAPLSAQLAYETRPHLMHLARSWLFEALAEIDQLPRLASDSGFAAPSEKSMESARGIARACSYFRLNAPAFDVRESGEIEVFCREGPRGLLLLIHPNNVFQIFGDFEGDQWRARYNLAGPTWNRHLRKLLQEIAPV